MSSFNKKGFKTSARVSGKYHAKSVNTILEQLDFVYRELDTQEDITPLNLIERATPLMGRDLDELEIDVLIRKLGFELVENEQEDNTK